MIRVFIFSTKGIFFIGLLTFGWIQKDKNVKIRLYLKKEDLIDDIK